MKTLFSILFNWEKYLIIFLFSMMIVLVFLITVFRSFNLFTGQFVWAEESARYMMIWMAFLGIGPAAIDNLHFRVTAFSDLFKGSIIKKIIDTTAVVITVSVLAIALYYGAGMVMRIFVIGQSSPVMRIPMWIPYIVIPIGLTNMLIRTLVREFFRERR